MDIQQQQNRKQSSDDPMGTVTNIPVQPKEKTINSVIFIKKNGNKTQNSHQNIFQKLFSKIGPGSLSSCIFNLCILSLGTGSLAIPKNIKYMSIFFSPIIIMFIGYISHWTITVLYQASKKYHLFTYEDIIRQILGKNISKFVSFVMCINQLGCIILYQVIMYKLIGGIINEIFNLGYLNMEDFVNRGLWGNFWVKFSLCYLIMGAILYPLCQLNSISKMRYASTFGVYSLFFLIFIVVIECPFRIKYNIINNKFHINIIDIFSGIKNKTKIFEAMSTIFYAFACHIGIFPVLETLHNPTEVRVKKLFKYSILIDIVCYCIIGISGYLTQPENTPDLIIQRYKINKRDYLMTFGQMCFVLTLIAKICANYNALRECIYNILHVKNKQLPPFFNKWLTFAILLLTTLCAVIFQSISDYIVLIGSFCSIIISCLIPGIIYIKGNKYPIFHGRNILVMVVIFMLSLTGFTSGCFTIKKIFGDNK